MHKLELLEMASRLLVTGEPNSLMRSSRHRVKVEVDMI